MQKIKAPVIKTADALIIFVDLIDSCQYSAYLKTEEYAKQILTFQKQFKMVIDSYFPSGSTSGADFFSREARGDEGVVMYADSTKSPSELIYDAVQLSFEIKGNLEMTNSAIEGFKPMRVGIGIHYGPISIVSPDTTVIGYSINICKRIETLSRTGRYSNIFISRDAHRLLGTDPILFAKHTADLRGLQTNETVYEVISAFFEEMPRERANGSETSDLIGFYVKHYTTFDYLMNPWQKSMVASILLTAASDAAGRSKSLADPYYKKAYDFCWRDPVENDPIMLYLRAIERAQSKNLTKAATILKELANKFPDFINARLKLAKVCWELSHSSPLAENVIFARDIAHEFLNRYPHVLTETEIEFFKDVSST